MAETTKKAKAPAKPRKSGTKATPAPADAQQVAASNGSAAEAPVTKAQSKTNSHLVHTSHDEIARLAHQYWNERGRQHGKDVDDWYRAEQVLHRRAS
jgi:hypothetical protein